MADTSTGSGFDFTSMIPGIMQLITGGLSLGQGNNITSLGNQYADIADPFRSQRPQYQTMMSDLMKGPNAVQDFLKTPGAVLQSPEFQAALGVGTGAVNRAAGSRQMAGSGNRLTDLQQYGTSMGMNYMNQVFNQLLQGRQQAVGELLPLTGATSGQPGMGAMAASMGTQQTGQNIGAGVAGIGGGIASLLSNPNVMGLISKLVGGAGSDFSSLIGSLGGDTNQFLQSVFGGNFDPSSLFGIDPNVASDISNVISYPGGGSGLDLGTINNIDLGSLFGGGQGVDWTGLFGG